MFHNFRLMKCQMAFPAKPFDMKRSAVIWMMHLAIRLSATTAWLLCKLPSAFGNASDVTGHILSVCLASKRVCLTPFALVGGVTLQAVSLTTRMLSSAGGTFAR